MNPVLNPYTPNAGARPPVLVGRDSTLDDFSVLLRRLERGNTSKSLLLTGLRGVGKTVLLNEFERRAEQSGWLAVWAEVSPRYDFSPRMYSLVRKALFELSPRENWSNKFKKVAAILRSFSLTFTPEGEVKVGLEDAPLEGTGDSGFLDRDLTELLCALGEAAKEADRGVVFLFDELQFLAAEELEGLVVALHRVVQRELPLTLVGAGLPLIPELAGDARSYAERLFKMVQVGRLTDADAGRALTEPANEHGVKYAAGALEKIYEFTQGYPYFVQEYGKALWNNVDSRHIHSTHVATVEEIVTKELDETFFRIRSDRATPKQMKVLRAMANVGQSDVPLDEVCRVSCLAQAEIQETMDDLVERAMVFSPRFGYYAFTVPHYGEYLIRRFVE